MDECCLVCSLYAILANMKEIFCSQHRGCLSVWSERRNCEVQCVLQNLVPQLCLQLASGESAYSYKGLAVQHSEYTKEGKVYLQIKETQKKFPFHLRDLYNIVLQSYVFKLKRLKVLQSPGGVCFLCALYLLHQYTQEFHTQESMLSNELK